MQISESYSANWTLKVKLDRRLGLVYTRSTRQFSRFCRDCMRALESLPRIHDRDSYRACPLSVSFPYVVVHMCVYVPS